MTPKKDMPNSVLAKLMSLDFLLVIVMTAVAWGVLTQRVAGIEEEQKEAKVKQDLYSEQATRTSNLVILINNNQEHFRSQIDKLDAKLDSIQTAVSRPQR